MCCLCCVATSDLLGFGTDWGRNGLVSMGLHVAALGQWEIGCFWGRRCLCSHSGEWSPSSASPLMGHWEMMVPLGCGTQWMGSGEEWAIGTQKRWHLWAMGTHGHPWEWGPIGHDAQGDSRSKRVAPKGGGTHRQWYPQTVEAHANELTTMAGRKAWGPGAGDRWRTKDHRHGRIDMTQDGHFVSLWASGRERPWLGLRQGKARLLCLMVALLISFWVENNKDFRCFCSIFSFLDFFFSIPSSLNCSYVFHLGGINLSSLPTNFIHIYTQFLLPLCRKHTTVHSLIHNTPIYMCRYIPSFCLHQQQQQKNISTQSAVFLPKKRRKKKVFCYFVNGLSY